MSDYNTEESEFMNRNKCSGGIEKLRQGVDGADKGGERDLPGVDEPCSVSSMNFGYLLLYVQWSCVVFAAKSADYLSYR